MSAIDLSSLALILAATARGTTRIAAPHGLEPDGLAAALVALGARVTATAPGDWTVQGTGIGGWREPDRVLDLAARPGAVPLLAGSLASHPFTAVLSGDSGNTALSLTMLRRSLERVGARFTLRRLDRLPGTVTGAEWPLPALHVGLGATEGMALLLAGLNSPGRTGVSDTKGLEAGIDLLRRFGAKVDQADGMAWVTGHPDLKGTDVAVSA